VLLEVPDDNNWSEFPNIDSEVRGHLRNCAWYEVYDVIEAIWSSLKRGGPKIADGEFARDPWSLFEEAINRVFVRKGIGWKCVEGRIEVRGPEAFEVAVTAAVEQLDGGGLPTAANELHKALRALGQRPEPDVTGAIQHAMAAAECVAREATGDRSPTFGTLLARHDSLLPAPLNTAMTKLWGYASENGRHVREGRVPGYDEGELTVAICAGVAAYLEKKIKSATS